MKKLFGLAVLSVLLAFAGSAAAQDTIKIGATEPLSGTFKDIGERYLEGVQYAAKVINESGGLLGKKVEVIPIDSELKPDVATRKAQNLILRDGVKFFCGGTGSSVGAAMSQLAEKQNVIMFTYGMDASSMTGEKCNRNFFRPGGSTDGRSFALAQLIAQRVVIGGVKACVVLFRIDADQQAATMAVAMGADLLEEPQRFVRQEIAD